MGPTQTFIDQGAGYISMIASILGLDKESELSQEETEQLIKQIKDPVGTFYRFTLPKSFMRRRKG
jgi:F420-non-reducing hydrogenase small subunit